VKKTIAISGLHTMLAVLQPALKSILGNTLKLADGVVLNLPDASTLSFEEGGDPESIVVRFNGVTATVNKSVLLGLIPIRGTEPVTYAAVSPRSVETTVSMFQIVAVDG
jgi:hypothetical protein